MSRIKKSKLMTTLICDKSQPLERRHEVFRMVAGDDTPSGAEARETLLGLLENSNGEDLHAAKIEQLAQLMSDLEEGPFRPAYFMRMMPANGSPSTLAQVLLDDGSTAYSVVPKEHHAEGLHRGERVLLDRQGKALLRRAGEEPRIGEEARFERVLSDGRLEVTLRGDERAVFFASKGLLDKIEAGETEPGSQLVVNARLSLALDVVPVADGLSHYRYLVKTPPVEVVAERDMGAPPWIIKDLVNHVRVELTNPEVRRAFLCPRSRCALLQGPPGEGKTMSIQAIIHGVARLLAEVSGLPVEDLPRFVFQLRLSNVLNPYYGVSDQNLDRFFDEVEERAGEPLVAADGREIPMPVVAVAEELDGLAMQRGIDPNGVHDRVLTTMLQRLDQTRPELRDRLIIFIGTTNEPQRVDAAMIRRIGGTIVKLGRPGRAAFAAIVRKHLAGRPLVTADKHLGPDQQEAALERDLTAWLYSPNGSDPGVVELTFAGSGSPEIRYRRDFVTADLIGRSVREACNEAVEAVLRADGEPAGLTFDRLALAFDRQIRGAAEQLNEHNAPRYLDLPDGVRVASVRRLSATATATATATAPLQFQAS